VTFVITVVRYTAPLARQSSYHGNKYSGFDVSVAGILTNKVYVSFACIDELVPEQSAPASLDDAKGRQLYHLGLTNIVLTGEPVIESPRNITLVAAATGLMTHASAASPTVIL
jgi:hypothetical protein